MTTAYTSLLGLALPVTGELSGTWGDTVNNSITSLLDSAVAGTTNVSTDGDVTLTTTTGAANTAREAILLFSGARTALRTVTAPAQSKIYTVINATTGGYSVKLVGAGPTTGVTIIAGESAVCAWNGSDFIKISNTSGAGVFTSITDTGLTSGRVTYATTGGLLTDDADLTFDGTTLSTAGLTASGTVTLSGGTANGVAYLNGSKVVTSGSALTFDGTNFTTTRTQFTTAGSPPASGAGLEIIGGTSPLLFAYNRGTSAYLPLNSTASAFGWALSGSDAMILTSTGLGIGTSSPQAKLVVSNAGAAGYEINPTGGIGGGATVSTYNRSTSAYTSLTTYSSAMTWYNGSTRAMDLDASGNFLVGTSTALASATGRGNITINGSTDALLAFGNATALGGYILRNTSGITYFSDGDTYQRFFINSSEVGRFTSTGLGIGTSSPASKLHVGGSTGQVTTPTAIQMDNTYGTATFDALKFYLFKGASESYGFGLGALAEVQYWAGSSSTGTHVWYTSQTERLRLNASGNLGLGVTPSGWSLSGLAAMQVKNGGLYGYDLTEVGVTSNAYYGSSAWRYVSGAQASRFVQVSGQHQWFTAPSGTAGNAITFTQAMTLTADGALAIGTTSPTAKLHVSNGGAAGLEFSPISGYLGGGYIQGYNRSTSAFMPVEVIAESFGVVLGSSRALTVDSSGNLLVGTTDSGFTTGSGFKFGVGTTGVSSEVGASSSNGDITKRVYSTGAGAYRFYVGYGGTVYATSTSISAISDATLKENVRDLETGLTEVMALKPRRFDWKNGDAQNVAGFIAQEVEQVLPELITDYQYSEGVTKKSLKMGDILPTLVNAIQEQQAIINSLKARLDAANL